MTTKVLSHLIPQQEILRAPTFLNWTNEVSILAMASTKVGFELVGAVEGFLAIHRWKVNFFW
jgi:hypothetical protein